MGKFLLRNYISIKTDNEFDEEVEKIKKNFSFMDDYNLAEELLEVII